MIVDTPASLETASLKNYFCRDELNWEFKYPNWLFSEIIVRISFTLSTWEKVSVSFGPEFSSIKDKK